MTKKVKLPENAFKSETETKIETCRNILNDKSLEFEEIAQEIVESFGKVDSNIFYIKSVLYKVQQARILVSVILMMTVKRRLVMMKMLMWFALTEDVSLLPGSAWKMRTVR